jgi:hypothetical protein
LLSPSLALTVVNIITTHVNVNSVSLFASSPSSFCHPPPTGNVYVGDFKEDTRTGTGKFSHFLGTIVMNGKWAENKFLG